MGVVGRLDQYASMLGNEFDDYSMSENLHLYSQEFDNASWTKTNASITPNATTAPDGTLTADALIENATPSVGHTVYENVTYITGRTYTHSCYFKLYPGPITRYVRLQLGNTAALGSDTYININLSTGLITNTPALGATSSIANVGNGWYRASITNTYTGPGISSIPAIIIINTAGTALYTDADGLSGVYIWGAQWEESSTVTDYTPTTTTAISRVLPATTNTNITGLGTYYSSGFDENVGFTTFLTANISPPYDPVYDEFGGTLFGAGQGRYMRQNTDKSVIVYNEIDEVTSFAGTTNDISFWTASPQTYTDTGTSNSGEVLTSTIFTSATLTATGFGSNVPIDFDFISPGSTGFVEIYKNNSLLFSYTNNPTDSSYNVSYNNGDTFYFKVRLSTGVLLPGATNPVTHTLILKVSGGTIFTFNFAVNDD